MRLQRRLFKQCFDWSGWEGIWLVCVCPQIWERDILLVFCFGFAMIKLIFTILYLRAYMFFHLLTLLSGAFLSSDTHLSALTYSSSMGTHGTFPSRTPVWMSLNCRPRFSPRMVTLVPPWRGPVSGNNWNKRNDRKNNQQEMMKEKGHNTTKLHNTHNIWQRKATQRQTCMTTFNTPSYRPTQTWTHRSESPVPVDLRSNEEKSPSWPCKTMKMR